MTLLEETKRVFFMTRHGTRTTRYVWPFGWITYSYLVWPQYKGGRASRPFGESVMYKRWIAVGMSERGRGM